MQAGADCHLLNLMSASSACRWQAIAPYNGRSTEITLCGHSEWASLHIAEYPNHRACMSPSLTPSRYMTDRE